MFIDTADVIFRAGSGGNGAVSFHREKYIASGGPDGGDGGRGGHIYLRADDRVSTLSDFRYRHRFSAENGGSGQSARRTGKNGDDLTLRVPGGTLVKDAETGRILADLADGETVLIAAGGGGGRGNARFATATRQAPRFSTDGAPGQTVHAFLELKLLADAGLVGLPNAGKSTLLSAVSEAKPKIADYPFTTLSPVLGTVRPFEGVSFVLADLPGLVDGAAGGAGLGHDFLRHIERCRMLIHAVDLSAEDPAADFLLVRRELAAFSPALAERPVLVAGTKLDLADPVAARDTGRRFADSGYRFFPLSALSRTGTDALVAAAAQTLQNLPPVARFRPEPAPDAGVEDPRAFRVFRKDGGFGVEGEWLNRLLQRTNPNDAEQMRYFQRVLVRSGVIDALKNAGIREGDTVWMYGTSFDYIP